MNTGANLNNIQMYEHIYKTYGFKHTLNCYSMVNIINGGKHAGGKLKIQEFMIVPSNELSCEDQTQLICEIYYNLKIVSKNNTAKHLLMLEMKEDSHLILTHHTKQSLLLCLRASILDMN